MSKEERFNDVETVSVKDKPRFSETVSGETTRFACSIDDKEVGSISATLVGENTYNVGGLFVDPAERGQGISSQLVKLVNSFLKENKALGQLVNTVKGEVAVVYERNGWTRGDYKSHGAYGAYEYHYDGR